MSRDKINMLADLLLDNSEVLIVGTNFNHQAHIYESSNGFDIDIYPMDAVQDEDGDFDSEPIDGGIIEDGDELDAVIYALSF